MGPGRSSVPPSESAKSATRPSVHFHGLTGEPIQQVFYTIMCSPPSLRHVALYRSLRGTQFATTLSHSCAFNARPNAHNEAVSHFISSQRPEHSKHREPTTRVILAGLYQSKAKPDPIYYPFSPAAAPQVYVTLSDLFRGSQDLGRVMPDL